MCCLIWQRSPDLRLDRFGASISEERHYACVSHSFARVLRTFIKTTSATGSPYTCRHSPGGEIGRHSGLKIRRRQNVVPVRVGSGAPKQKGVHFHGLPLNWSGIRDSNSRPIPWQGIALPTELIPHIHYAAFRPVEPEGLTGGAARSRTGLNGFAIRRITALLPRQQL